LGITDIIAIFWNRSPTLHSGAVYACDFAPHGQTIVSASGDTTLKLWDVESGTCQAKKTLRGHSGSVFAVAWSINGLLASGSYDRTVKIWNPSADECLKTLHCCSGMVFACEFAPDGKTLASGSDCLKIWDVALGTCQATLEEHKYVRTVAWSFDGKLLASGGSEGRINMWDAKKGKHLTVLKGHSAQINCVEFSSDGTMLASCSGRSDQEGRKDNSVRLWDVGTGMELKKLLGQSHESGV
jgi:WD40 repeat protein